MPCYKESSTNASPSCNTSRKRTPLLPFGRAVAERRHEMGEYWCDTVLCSKEAFEKIYFEQKGLGKKYADGEGKGLTLERRII
jgi:hypothetical protein